MLSFCPKVCTIISYNSHDQVPALRSRYMGQLVSLLLQTSIISLKSSCLGAAIFLDMELMIRGIETAS